jgi:hypothetical protein
VGRVHRQYVTNLVSIPTPLGIARFDTRKQIGEIIMLCTVIDIRGDYAYVKYDETGVVSEVAIALLPWGIDIGDRLKFEDYEFSQV